MLKSLPKVKPKVKPKVEYKLSTAGHRRRWLAVVSSVALVFVATSPSLDFEGFFSRMLADAETVRMTTSSSSSSKPNMLLLVLDQWRYDWDGMTADTPTGTLPLKMPFLEAAAKRGVRFTQAYVPAPLCAPVRACLASAKEYDECGVLTNHADSWPLDQDTFYKLMRDQSDYDIFTCGKDDLYRDEVHFPFFSNLGGDDTTDLGFTNAMRSAGKHRVTKEHPPYERFRSFLEEREVGNGTKVNAYDVYKHCFDGPTGPGRTWPIGSHCSADKFTSEIYPDDFVHREAISLIEQSQKDKPWYLQVNFPGPHAPEMSTAEMAASVSGRTWPSPYDAPDNLLECPQTKGLNDNVPHMGGRCNYAAELENLDKLMHNIFTYLHDAKVSDNTIICMVGDHGEMLGDHGMMGKKVPWQASISVPLVCFGPGIKQGVVYNDPVTTLDLAGTFMDFAGTKPNDDMTSKSLKPFMTEGTTPPREFISSGMMQWRLVVQVVGGVSYKLICCKGPCGGPSPTTVTPPVGDWHMLLYDTQADRFDMSPIGDKPAIVEKLQKNLPDGWCTGAQISVKTT